MDKAALTSLVGRVPLLGRGLRLLARHYAEGSVVEIRQGLAAGFRWKRHHRHVNGYWIGHYELPLQRLLGRELSAGQTFYDVGANAGFFTLVAARLVGAKGRCVAFEPLPGNIESIREQVRLNSLHQCVIVPEAVGAHAGKARFAFASVGDSQARLDESRRTEGETIEVRVTTLDLAMQLHGVPHFVKLDVEGAEVPALKGAARMLALAKPKLLIELHGPDCARQVRECLMAHDYRLFDLDARELPASAEMPRHVFAKAG